MFDPVKQAVEAHRETLVRDRRDFHRHAESRWTEFRTSALIAQRLTALGYEVLAGPEVCAATSRMGLPTVHDLDAHWERAAAEGAPAEYLDRMKGGFTGVIGILRRGSGPTVALRFDIDALNIQESDAPDHRPAREGFASIHAGVCHACGHDGHAAIGLAVANVLKRFEEKIHGTVKLIFQPAEEGVSGARSIVEAGHLDDVDFTLAQHVMTGWSVGEIVPGIGGYAATEKFDVHFVGEPAHAGGCPEGGHNALLAAASAVLNLHALPRHQAGFTRINVGRMVAGTGRNVIPADADLVVEVRGETSELCDSMHAKAIRVVEAAAAMYGCSVSIRAMGAAGTAESDRPLAERVTAVARQIGPHTMHSVDKMGGSEDFTEMMRRVQDRGGQACYVGIGADLYGIRHHDANRVQVLAAHTGRYDFDENALILAAELFSALALDLTGTPS